VIAVPQEAKLADAAKWKKEFKAGFPFVYDPKGAIAEAYGVEAMPFNVVIDRNGKVTKVILGADTAALDAAIKKVARK